MGANGEQGSRGHSVRRRRRRRRRCRLSNFTKSSAGVAVAVVVCVGPSSTCIEVYSLYTHSHTQAHIQARTHREGALSTRQHATLVHMIASAGLVVVSSFDLNVLKFKDRIAFGLFARTANANATARRKNFKL